MFGIYSSTDNTIYNYDPEVSIVEGTDGNDEIHNSSDTENVTVNAGKGDDFIYNYGNGAYISGSEGADYISNEGENVTINGGKGDDEFHTDYSSGNVFIYASGDGNDYIGNYHSNDTISIIKGSIDNISIDGYNVVLTVNEGSITLEGAIDKPINVLQNDK